MTLSKTKFSLKTALLCAFLIIPNASWAQQSSLPEFSLSDSSKKIQSTNTIQPLNQKISISRQLTKDILLLQEQINLLTVLIDRQSEIQKIAKNYEQLGIPFKQPRPSQNVCKKLPKNVLCLHSYPDQETEENITSLIEQKIQEKQQTAYQAAVEAFTNLPQDNTDLDSFIMDNTSDMGLQPVFEKPENFSWDDIQCLAKKCNALIRSDKDEKFMMRLSHGDNINTETKIVSITPMGVKVKKDGEIKSIPSTGTKVSALSPPILVNPIQKQEEIKEKPPTTSSSEQVTNKLKNLIESNLAPSTEQPTDNGMLGPTGLF